MLSVINSFCVLSVIDSLLIKSSEFALPVSSSIILVLHVTATFLSSYPSSFSSVELKQLVFLMITSYTTCLNVIPLVAICVRPGPQFCNWRQNCAVAVQTQWKPLLPRRDHSVNLGDGDMVGSIIPFRDVWITEDSLTCLGLHRHTGQNYILTMASHSHWAHERTVVWTCSLWILVQVMKALQNSYLDINLRETEIYIE